MCSCSWSSASPSTGDQRRTLERLMGCWHICPQGLGLWSVFNLYLSKCLALVKKERDGNEMWNVMDTQPSTGPEGAWRPALGDGWKPRQRTWIWGGGAQICSPLRRRWPQRGGSLRYGLCWWEAALRCETWEWPETRQDVCGAERKSQDLYESKIRQKCCPLFLTKKNFKIIKKKKKNTTYCPPKST